MQEKADIPPHDNLAEDSVIGCILRNEKVLADIGDILTEDDFYAFPAKVAYGCLTEMSRDGRPIDIVTLADYVQSKGKISDCHYSYIAEVYASCPSTVNAVHYARIVVERSKRRRVIQGCQEFLRRAYDLADPVDSVVADGGDLFFSTLAMGKSQHAKPQSEVVKDFYQLLDRQNRGSGDGEVEMPYLTTGWAGLDAVITGFFKSEFSLVAARPSIGKTVFAGCLAHRIASRGHHVLFCSLEQKDVAILQRMFSTVTKIPGWKITRGHLDQTDMDCLLSHGENIEALPIWWVDSPSQTVGQIASVAKRLKMRGRLDAVIVDYLQIIKPEFGKRNQNRADEIGDISWGLKQLARELEIPVISLAQLNRQMANRSDSVPKLSDLRDSGRIEQDGDTIILLHKDQEPDTKRPLDEMVAIVAKQRNGPLGSIPLLHHKEIFDITDALGGGDGGEF